MAKCKKCTKQYLAMHRIDRLKFWKILFIRVQFPFTPIPPRSSISWRSTSSEGWAWWGRWWRVSSCGILMQKPAAWWDGSVPAPTYITFPKWGFPRPSAAGKYIAGSSRQVPPNAFGTCSVLPKTRPRRWRFSANSGASRGSLSAIPPSRATSKVFLWYLQGCW